MLYDNQYAVIHDVVTISTASIVPFNRLKLYWIEVDPSLLTRNCPGTIEHFLAELFVKITAMSA